jgi:hypothetical protein
VISAASPAGPRLSSAAVDERAAGSEEPKTAPPVASEVIAAREPALGEIQSVEDDATDAALFREFLQWRAERCRNCSAKRSQEPSSFEATSRRPDARSNKLSVAIHAPLVSCAGNADHVAGDASTPPSSR